MVEDEIREAGRRARFERWEQLGVDVIRTDLEAGGHSMVGGPPAVRKLAWEWVRMKEGGRDKPPPDKSAEIFILKPTIWGVGIDLRAAWKAAWRKLCGKLI